MIQILAVAEKVDVGEKQVVGGFRKWATLWTALGLDMLAVAWDHLISCPSFAVNETGIKASSVQLHFLASAPRILGLCELRSSRCRVGPPSMYQLRRFASLHDLAFLLSPPPEAPDPFMMKAWYGGTCHLPSAVL